MRRAYDYWQDQPGNCFRNLEKLAPRGRPPYVGISETAIRLTLAERERLFVARRAKLYKDVGRYTPRAQYVAAKLKRRKRRAVRLWSLLKILRRRRPRRSYRRRAIFIIDNNRTDCVLDLILHGASPIGAETFEKKKSERRTVALLRRVVGACRSYARHVRSQERT